MDRVDSKFMQPGATPGLPVFNQIKRLDGSDIVSLLSVTDDKSLAALFDAASMVRRQVFGDKIFMTGFVYFSTYCRNECTFCSFRRSNTNKMLRYRKEPEEILEVSKRLANSGVNLIDLTMGEDAEYYGQQKLATLVKDIKRETGLPVMVSPGMASRQVIEGLAEAGADWLALYQETHNKVLFEKLRLYQSYEDRMDAKRYARSLGMLIEEGVLTGVGETIEDLAHSILEMKRIGASQMRVMSFCPQPGTPMEDTPTANRLMELKAIAVMRLLSPEALIPASLDVDGLGGLMARIRAGANVVTSIIPPATGLLGVATASKSLGETGRTAKEASDILKSMGLRAATNEDYSSFCLR